MHAPEGAQLGQRTPLEPEHPSVRPVPWGAGRLAGAPPESPPCPPTAVIAIPGRAGSTGSGPGGSQAALLVREREPLTFDPVEDQALQLAVVQPPQVAVE